MNALVKKEVNFITASKRKEKKSEKKASSVILLVIIPVLLFLIIVGICTFILLQISSYKIMTAQEQVLLQSPKLAEKNSRMMEVTKEISKLKQQKVIVDKTNLILKAKSELNQNQIKAVLDNVGESVTIKDISYTNGVLSITASTSTYDEPPKFVQRLEKTDKFIYIDYVGFSQDTDETGTSFVFTINAVLNIAEDKQDEE